jgi:hypothetical protein
MARNPLSQPSKPRARLTEAQVVTIFQAKASSPSAASVATVFGVCEKAVRDIWTGRTWSRETQHLDNSQHDPRLLKGRSKGCRDRQPRKNDADDDELSAPIAVRPSPRVRSPKEFCIAAHALKRETPQILDQHVHGRISDSTTRFESTSDWPCAAGRHASVDDQLHDWDGFWTASSTADPFYGDVTFNFDIVPIRCCSSQGHWSSLAVVETPCLS